ncbi:MAG: GtrA family protein [Cytophagales bacterium]|nr:GtrA family protein [Cytophagales bacterium]
MIQKLSLLPDTFKQMIKYGLIGLLNLSIYLVIFEILTRLLNVYYLYANFIASIISFANSLYFNRKWTFKSNSHWLRDTLYFLVIFLVCLSIQSLTLYFCVEYLKWDPQLAKYAGIVTFAAFNFSLNKLITFRRKATAIL